MNGQSPALTAALCSLISLYSVHASASIPGPPSWAPEYQRVWTQDFTTMTDLSQLRVSDTSIGAGIWIAHKPGGGDWFTFQNPTAPYHPFGVGHGYLTVRVQKDGHDPNNWFGGYSGGLLSSLDGSGKGFSQQYGYFECSMWTPGSPNTWPAFWLLDAPSVTNPKLNAAEIDITESYGNWGTGPGQKPPGDPNEDAVTWHRWGNSGNPTSANGSFAKEPDMTTGFHTYGADVEPTGITWYYDRKKIWWAPIFPEAERPLYVLVNLALGGGTHNNAKGDGYDWNLTPNPVDLKVRYVAVWASPASPNYEGPPGRPANLTVRPGNGLVVLSWSPALGAASYNIYRDQKLVAAGIPGTNYIDRKVANRTTYRFKVTAVSHKGTGPASEELAAKPRDGPPMETTGLRALPGDGQITLAWTPSPDAASYTVYRGSASGSEGAQPVATEIKTASFVDRRVTDGSPYFYTVAAVSGSGVSHRSNEANGIPASAAETVAVSYAGKPPTLEDVTTRGAAPGAYPINRLALGDPTTTNGAFQLMWDPANLYCLFTVNDSTLVSGTPDYNGDAVELYLDARNTRQTHYDATDFRYTLGYGHDTISEPVHSATAGVRYERKLYQGGYRELIAIPWRTLHTTPFVGMSLGVDAAIDDATTRERGRSSALFWRDSTANDYQNPTLFGNATLEPGVPPPPLPDGIYKVINVKSGKALDVPGASEANVALDQAQYEGGTNQQWILTSLGGGSYAIQNVKSRSVVDCSPTFDEAHPVVQWPISGTPSATQRFTVTAVKSHYLLTNVFSGKVLDVANSSTTDRAPIIQSACTVSDSQLWDLAAVR